MLQNGDKFFANDLIESMHELYDFKVKLGDSDPILMVQTDANKLVRLSDMSAKQYATQKMKAYNVESSAKALDAHLKASGFRTTRKFSHEYNIVGLSYDQIVHDAYCLEYFYECIKKCQPKNKDWGQVFDDAMRMTFYYAQYIWHLNQKDKLNYNGKLNMYKDTRLLLGYLQGVGFQFHPNDVYEYVMNHLSTHGARTISEQNNIHKRQQVFKDWCMNKYGIDTGCLVLHPESQEKLRKILIGTDTPYLIQLVKKYSNKLLGK